MVLRSSIFLLLIIISFNLFSYPEISGNNSDIFYKQLQSDILENGKRLISGDDIIPLQFYNYKTGSDDTIFTVAARFNLSYETIATLNDLNNQLFFDNRESIYIPNCPGIFSTQKLYKNPLKINVMEKDLFFYPGKTFNGKERLNFLSTPFKSPLKMMKITSDFGNRENPFTGRNEFHSGVDLKASIGTTLYAPSDGIINNIGYSDFYGNYLIVTHDGGYSTHYYHLNKVTVNLNKYVKSGDPIAITGNSGRSTGPHLHMEIHYGDKPVDPRPLLGEI